MSLFGGIDIVMWLVRWIVGRRREQNVVGRVADYLEHVHDSHRLAARWRAPAALDV